MKHVFFPPEVKKAPAKPRLTTGAQAVAHSKDATLKSLGVATQRMAGEVIPEADDDAEGSRKGDA